MCKLAQALHRQNRQLPLLGQVRSYRYSSNNQAERDLESNLIRRQTTRNRYPQKAQHIFKRIEQENSMGYSQAGNSNQNQVVPNTK